MSLSASKYRWMDEWIACASLGADNNNKLLIIKTGGPLEPALRSQLGHCCAVPLNQRL